jgi:hypothetical protein
MKTITFLLITFLIFAATPSCGGTQAAGSIGDTVTACATVDIGKTEPEIGMTIYQDASAIIQAGEDGWVAALESIGIKYGYDVLTCALQAVFDKQTSHPANMVAAVPSEAAKRAQSFMASHHLKTAP